MKFLRSVFSSVALVVFLCVLVSQGKITDAQTNATMQTIDVGVILDLSTWVGRMTESCLSMALPDYYAAHNNTATRLVLHIRDSHQDVVDAASSVVDLMKTHQVQAILGPQSSSEAEFVVDIGNKAQVPIISFTATSPSISSRKTPYFIRTTLNDSTQVKAIAAIVEVYGWREVVPVYEDTDYGEDMIPYLTDAIQDVNARVPYRSILSFSFTDNQIRGELYKLMTMQTRIFVVHMRSVLASRLFSIAKDVGMMKKGYVWIITDGITDQLRSMDAFTAQSMQGLIGLKPYVPRSGKLDNFRSRWKRKFILDNPDVDDAELSVVGLLAYDSVWALANAAEKVKTISPRFKKPYKRNSSADLDTLGTSQIGKYLLESILQTNINGLSGEFRLKDGQLQSWAFQIVNIIGKGEREVGFWTPAHGILTNLDVITTSTYTVSKDNLLPIIWPGETTEVPKGWEIPTSEKKLTIGIPVNDGFSQFVKLQKNPNTNSTEVTGFCIDVFKAVIESIPYATPYEFELFEKAGGQSAGSYNDLIYQVFLQKYDAVVGDVTILANRSKYVDFTLPFTESGVSMVVPLVNDDRKNAWIFLKPLTMGLWLMTGLFFIITGSVVWILEHRINEEFQGNRSQQAGIICWFAFSTLVFAHKERVESNLARFVLIICIFVVLILTSSYTANLTSLLTVQKFQPTVTDIRELIKNGDFVGCQKGSFVETGLMKSLGIDPNKIKAYNTIEEYHDALMKGSQNGGVSAIIDEIPYIQLFIAQNCKKYTMVGPTHRTAGFGFVFPKGSPLVPDISRAVLNVTEGEKMEEIKRAWFGNQEECPDQGENAMTSSSLTLDSFKGLFIIAGVSSGLALIIFLFEFLYEHKNILASDDSIPKKALSMASAFNKKKNSLEGSNILDSSRGTAIDGAANNRTDAQVPETSNSLHRNPNDQSRQDNSEASTGAVIQVPSAEITSAN